jgi:MoxR-like ATPase
VLAAKASAALDGRPCAEVRDVQRAATAVLRHRLVTTFEAESEGIRPDAIVARLLGEDPGWRAPSPPQRPGPGNR